jgi:hypothetical protein
MYAMARYSLSNRLPGQLGSLQLLAQHMGCRELSATKGAGTVRCDPFQISLTAPLSLS